MKKILYGILVVSGLCSQPVLAQTELAAIPLQTLEGKTLQPEELKGKITFISFWFIACSPCRRELPELVKLQAKYKDNHKIRFIAISKYDEPVQLSNFIKKIFNYTFEQVPKNTAWPDHYQVDLFPTNIILDKDGKVVLRQNGLVPNVFEFYDQAIQKLL